VWYKYEATEDRIVNIFTESYDFFHRITVFMGDSCGNNLSCHGTTVYNIFNLEYHFHAMRSTTYYILVTSGYSSSDVGAFSISVTVRTRCKKQRIFALFFTTKECSNTNHLFKNFMQYQESEIPQNDACENATELDLQSPSYLGIM
jgi:hypothetical protein